MSGVYLSKCKKGSIPRAKDAIFASLKVSYQSPCVLISESFMVIKKSSLPEPVFNFLIQIIT